MRALNAPIIFLMSLAGGCAASEQINKNDPRHEKISKCAASITAIIIADETLKYRTEHNIRTGEMNAEQLKIIGQRANDHPAMQYMRVVTNDIGTAGLEAAVKKWRQTNADMMAAAHLRHDSDRIKILNDIIPQLEETANSTCKDAGYSFIHLKAKGSGASAQAQAKPTGTNVIDSNSLQHDAQGQSVLANNRQREVSNSTEAASQSSATQTEKSPAMTYEKQISARPLDVIGIIPMTSTRDDVRARASRRLSNEASYFNIGGFELLCTTGFVNEKLSHLVCITGGDKSDDNIEIHNILKAGFSKKFGAPQISSNDPVRNGLGVSFSNEQLIWLDAHGNALALYARQGKVTQGSMALISAEARRAQQSTQDLIDRNRKF